MGDINIIEKCRKIHEEMKNGFQKCLKQNDNPQLIKAFIEMFDLQIETIETLSKLAITGPQKRKCFYTLVHLINIKDNIKDINNKIGSGLSVTGESKRVKWIDIESAFNDNIKSGIIKNINHIDIFQFFNDSMKIFINIIHDTLIKRGGMLKVYTILAATYTLVKSDEDDIKYFNTKAISLSVTTDLNEFFKEYIVTPLIKDMHEFQLKDSGWTLKSIDFLNVHISKFNPLHASSYIELPQQIKSKHACINVKNYSDNMCFKWAIMSALVYEKYGTIHNSDRLSEYLKYEDEEKYKDFEEFRSIDFDSLTYPFQPIMIPDFEKKNNLSINLYTLELEKNNYTVVTSHLTSCRKKRHINLLLIENYYEDIYYQKKNNKTYDDYYDDFFDDNDDLMNENFSDIENQTLTKKKKFEFFPQVEENKNYHYVWIKKLSSLLNTQLSKDGHKKYFCQICLHYFKSIKKLEKHEEDCSIMNKCKVLLPEDEQFKFIKFKNFRNKEKAPFIIYADFESILKKCDEGNIVQRHEAFSIGYYLKNNIDDTKSVYKSYRGKNPAQWFVERLYEIAKDLNECYTSFKKMENLNNEIIEKHKSASICHICEEGPFEDNAERRKVYDHDHLTGICS